MDAKNIACSACYGSGYGVDGKPCPCGCRPRPAPAIAPPVAAGSVDIAELRLMLIDHRHSDSRKEQDRHLDSIIYFVNAWGAQQREAGKAEQTAFLKECMVRSQDEFNRKWTEQKERAEKAEARVKELELDLLLKTPLVDQLRLDIKDLKQIEAAQNDSRKRIDKLGIHPPEHKTFTLNPDERIHNSAFDFVTIIVKKGCIWPAFFECHFEEVTFLFEDKGDFDRGLMGLLSLCNGFKVQCLHNSD